MTSQTYNDAGWVEDVTDPRGLVNRTTYDNLGRVTKTVEAYTDGTPSNDDDKTVEYTYDGNSNLLTLKAHLTGGAYQTTEYVYGVTVPGGSDIESNTILAEIKHPDPSSGNPSTTDKETFDVNALGERTSFTDRNGSVHDYSYDVVGRRTSDAVTTLASGVDGAVRRIETAYDTGGRAYLFTSYDAATAGNVVNEVQRDFNGLGQLITEYQEHGGAVNTGTSLKVQYAYSEMASSANHSRLTSMTYPDGRQIDFVYDTGLDSDVSRLSSIDDGATTLEAYEYLGYGTVVLRAHPEPDVDLTYIKQGMESNGDAGDQYTGLDRFGRVEDQRWIDTGTGSPTDRFKYGHDRNSNRLYRENVVQTDHSELYHADGASNGYDDLNQLTDFQRGTLNGAKDTISSETREQNWSFDALGNWSSVTTDSSTENRSHNKQNEITSISGQTTPTFDSNGNMTGDETGNTLVFDAWNRLVEVKDGSTTLTEYELDALNRRITEDPGTARALFYSAQWQVVEERESGVAVAQAVWSPVYVDAMILRDRDTDSNGSLDERHYVQHDANFNVTALISTSGSVVERSIYDPFGLVSFLTPSWSSRSSSSYDWIYLHQGGRFDFISMLYHFRNRDFSVILGRWVTLDPIGFDAGDLNLYRALSNNTINYLDPLGLAEATISGSDFIKEVIRDKFPKITELPETIGKGGLVKLLAHAAVKILSPGDIVLLFGLLKLKEQFKGVVIAVADYDDEKKCRCQFYTSPNKPPEVTFHEQGGTAGSIDASEVKLGGNNLGTLSYSISFRGKVTSLRNTAKPAFVDVIVTADMNFEAGAIVKIKKEYKVTFPIKMECGKKERFDWRPPRKEKK